ncbi:CLUMA_CG005424, isoform A [Clunio marinus]|uniref:CLUMA_CG005424, isoform A n=1 Tax=Clunio marinus TaxID=568069 RepID=A0A1J1I084_9DIPT|nr:CLUMA_CG005424, isoform A [Clunio marinus]
MNKAEKEKRFKDAILEIKNGSKIRVAALKHMVAERTLRRRFHKWCDSEDIAIGYQNNLREYRENVDRNCLKDENLSTELLSHIHDLNAVIPAKNMFSNFKNYHEKCGLCFNIVSSHESRIKLTDNIRNMIYSILQIRMLSDANCSNFLCFKCHDDLKYFYNFKCEIREKHDNFIKFISVAIEKCYDDFSQPFNEPLIKIEEIKTEPEFPSSLIFSEPLGELNSPIITEKINASEIIFKKEHCKSSPIEVPSTSGNYQNLGENISLKHSSKSPIVKPKIIDHQDISKSQLLPCDFCGKKFMRGQRMELHRTRVHLKIKNFECDICGLTFYGRCNVAYHMVKHIPKEHRSRDYQCDICNKLFYDKKMIKIHMRKCHGKEGNFPCSFCGKSFSTKYKLYYHKNNNHSMRNRKIELICEMCGKVLRSQKALFNHMVGVHKVWEGNTELQRTLTCEICGKRFFFESDLKSHKKVHGEKNVSCDFFGCPKKFKSNKELYDHKKYHNPRKKIPCSFPNCDKSFFTNQHLKSHVYTRHHKIRQPCPVSNVCGFSVGRKDYMRIHLKKHTELSNEELEKYSKIVSSMNLA